jgi:quercetin dioxygenase-like cupin family protein
MLAFDFIPRYSSSQSTNHSHMQHLRQLLLLACAFALQGTSSAQNSPAHASVPEVKVVSSVDVTEKVDGKESRCTTFEVTFAPGVAGMPHRHPGPIYGYVIEGEFEFAVDGEKPRLLKAGETFYEPAMALHSVSRNPGSKTKTRVLAIMVHPRDAKELVIPEPAK